MATDKVSILSDSSARRIVISPGIFSFLRKNKKILRSIVQTKGMVSATDLSHSMPELFKAFLLHYRDHYLMDAFLY
jgi:hypothetical protein